MTTFPTVSPTTPIRISRWAAGVAAVFGVVGLAGHALDVAAFASVTPHWAPISLLAATALTVLGGAWWVETLSGRGAGSERSGWAAALLVTILALAVVAQYAAERIAGRAGWVAMAPTAALAFLLVAAARLIRRPLPGAATALSEALAVVAALLGLAVLAAYAYGVSPQPAPAHAVPMAAGTAVGLVALSVSVIATVPGSRLVGILSAAPPGGTVARRVLPALVAIVFVQQWLVELGERVGWFGGPAGDALDALLSSVVLGALVLASAAAVNRTVAARRRAESEQRESEERLRAVFENAGVGLAYVTAEGRFLQVNRRLCEILGYPPAELMTSTFQDHTHPDHLDADVAQFRRLLAGEADSYSTEKRYLRKDGTAVWVGLTSAAVREPDGTFAHIVTAVTELSDLHRAQEQLRASEADYRLLVEHATVGIFRSTPGGRFLSVNPALVEMLGCRTAAEALALDLDRDVYAAASQRRQLLERLRSENVVTAEVEWVRRDGALIAVRERLRAVRDADGGLERLEGLAEDVTRQRHLEAQLRQSQRLEAVGRLAGGVAHDFNNVLTAIRGYTDLVLAGLPPGDPRRQDLEEVTAASTRAAGLTRQLLAFSRKQVLQPKDLDLNALVTALSRMLLRLIGEDVQLALALAPSVGAVHADPGQLEQVVLNLAVNARDAMPRGGRLTIETAEIRLDERYARDHPADEVVPGPYVMLAVTDTGTGMDAELQTHIFEPFFTTKDPGKGTGLGLATVYGIVRQSGGHVGVYSEPGRGSTFKVYLPRVGAPLAADKRAEIRAPVRGGTETVLLAEDDPAVREIAATALSARGYRVLRAPDGQTALEMARSHEGPVALLVTDLVMPGMTGRQLAEALCVEREGLRVLYMSGYTDDAVVRHGVLDANLPYLQKPFAPEDLARRVREVLDRT